MKTKAEKRKFIRDLTKSVTADLLQAVDKMPEEWDGVEMRTYIADKFEYQQIRELMPLKRLRAYRNEIVIRNL